MKQKWGIICQNQKRQEKRLFCFKSDKKRQTTFPKNQRHLDPQNVTIWRFRHDLVTLVSMDVRKVIWIWRKWIMGGKLLFFSAWMANPWDQGCRKRPQTRASTFVQFWPWRSFYQPQGWSTCAAGPEEGGRGGGRWHLAFWKPQFMCNLF